MGEKVFVGSCSGVFFALDRTTGHVAWSYDTRDDAGPAQFHGEPVAVGDWIVTGSDSAEPSYTYAFERATGRVVWKRHVDAPQTDILVAAGRLIGRSATGDLVGLDGDSGEVLWKVTDGGSRCGGHLRSPAVNGTTAYFADFDGALKAIDAADGSLLWKVDVGCAAGAPLVFRDHVYQGLEAPGVVRVALQDGSMAGTWDADGLPHSRLTPAGDVLVALVGEKKLVALTADLSRTVWELTTESDWSSFRPLLLRGDVVVGDSDGNLLFLDPKDGSTRWPSHLPGAIRGLGAAQDVLYVGTLQGTLYAFRPGFL